MKITLEFVNVKIRVIKKIKKFIKLNILILIKIKLMNHIEKNIIDKKMKIK